MYIQLYPYSIRTSITLYKPRHSLLPIDMSENPKSQAGTRLSQSYPSSGVIAAPHHSDPQWPSVNLSQQPSATWDVLKPPQVPNNLAPSRIRPHNTPSLSTYNTVPDLPSFLRYPSVSCHPPTYLLCPSSLQPPYSWSPRSPTTPLAFSPIHSCLASRV